MKPGPLTLLEHMSTHTIATVASATLLNLERVNVNLCLGFLK